MTGARAVAVGTVAVALLGCAAAQPSQISAGGAGAFEVDLATDGERLVAAWYDTRDGNAEIYVRVIAGTAARAAGERRLTRTEGESYVPDIALVGDGIAVAWHERSRDGDDEARLGLWPPTGAALWERTLHYGDAAGRAPLLRSVGERLFAAWIAVEPAGEQAVVAQWHDAAGRPVGTAIRLGSASADTFNLNGAVTADGRVLVVYDAAVDTVANEVFLAEIDATRAVTRRLTADDGYDSKFPDIAIGSAAILLSWQDERDGNTEVYVHAAEAARPTAPVDGDARRVTHTRGQSIGAYLATDDDGFALVWCDDDQGNYDVFFQAVTPDGELRGARRTLAATPGDSLIPAIARHRDLYAVAWNEVERGLQGYHAHDTRSAILFLAVQR